MAYIESLWNQRRSRGVNEMSKMEFHSFPIGNEHIFRSTLLSLVSGVTVIFRSDYLSLKRLGIALLLV